MYKRNIKIVVIAICLIAFILSLASCNGCSSFSGNRKGNFFGSNDEYISLEDLDFVSWLRYMGNTQFLEEDDEHLMSILAAEKAELEIYFNQYIEPAQNQDEFFLAVARFKHVDELQQHYNSWSYTYGYERKTLLDYLEKEYHSKYNDYDNRFNYPTENRVVIYEYEFPDLQHISYKEAVVGLLQQQFELNNKYGQSVSVRKFISIKNACEMTGHLLAVNRGTGSGASDIDALAKEMRYEIEEFFGFMEELPEFNKWYYDKYSNSDETLENVSWSLNKYLYYQISLRCYNQVQGEDIDIYEYVERIKNGLTPYKPYKSITADIPLA